MIELELDGKAVSAEPGSTILEVAIDQGKYIPHFCYHKKLSIAANCRMCLVEVEKVNKPVPACATPISEGMKVHTCSKAAVEAQKGVMEFLLINHPLDCPICDQGGECQLQDLAVGYGRSTSRFHEEKRAVTNKDLGALVKTEMTRCIHCSRCVRFTSEIAGYQELGISYRSNHAEVMPFIGKTVNSELSGNIIDICPVGALTSKPFRFHARSWELSRRKSIAPHDGLGSNIIVQVDKYHKVARVLPLENENLNECWLSDRDRFSYEGLYHDERVTSPMIKQNGKWMNVDWESAINYVLKSLSGVKLDHGNDAIGVLASAHSTTEELYLLQKLMRGLGIDNLDYRLNQSDFALDSLEVQPMYLGNKINDLAKNKSLLVIGCSLREEQPLLAHRIRNAVTHGLELNVINVVREDLLCEVKNQTVIDPRQLVYFLAQVVKATENPNSDSDIDLSQVEVSQEAFAIANSLKQHHGSIVLGEVAKTLPDYSQIVFLTHQLVKNINGAFGLLAGKANEVGAELVGLVPNRGAFNQSLTKYGMNASQMLSNPRKAYVLFNTELEHDAYDSNQALHALKEADTVIVIGAFMSQAMQEYADVILPIAPFTETAGSFVNMEGLWQKFNGATRPLEETKPGWKVLRVLANSFNLDGFEYNSITDVQKDLELLNDSSTLLNNSLLHPVKFKVTPPQISGLVRIGTVGIYHTDSITRRAESLQKTTWATDPVLKMNQVLANKLGINEQKLVTVKQAQKSVQFEVTIDNSLPENAVFLGTTAATYGFAGRFAAIEVSA